jgi:hypothetical protein
LKHPGMATCRNTWHPCSTHWSSAPEDSWWKFQGAHRTRSSDLRHLVLMIRLGWPQDPQDPQVSHVMVGGPLFGQMEAQKCEASVKLIACLYILYHVYAKSIPLWSCHVKISMIYAMFMPCQCHLTISNRTRISNPLEGPAEPRGALEPIQHLHVSVRALADSDQRLATNRWILAMALA